MTKAQRRHASVVEAADTETKRHIDRTEERQMVEDIDKEEQEIWRDEVRSTHVNRLKECVDAGTYVVKSAMLARMMQHALSTRIPPESNE